MKNKQAIRAIELAKDNLYDTIVKHLPEEKTDEYEDALDLLLQTVDYFEDEFEDEKTKAINRTNLHNLQIQKAGYYTEKNIPFSVVDTPVGKIVRKD